MRSQVRWVVTVGIGGLMLISGRRIAAQDQRTAILNAERATAELSRDSGLAGALLGSIHRDGILLWPGAPVVAGTSDLKRFLTALAADSLQLTWQPLSVELARDSSLGITWGVAVANASRGAPPEIGSYIAAWRRDGARWKIAALVFAGLGRLPKPVLSGEIPMSRKAIEARGSGPFVAADLAFARLAADSGAAVAFERWAAPEAVTFGDRGLLTRGPRLSAARLTSLRCGGGIRWLPAPLEPAISAGPWAKQPSPARTRHRRIPSISPSGLAGATAQSDS